MRLRLQMILALMLVTGLSVMPAASALPNGFCYGKVVWYYNTVAGEMHPRCEGTYVNTYGTVLCIGTYYFGFFAPTTSPPWPYHPPRCEARVNIAVEGVISVSSDCSDGSGGFSCGGIPAPLVSDVLGTIGPMPSFIGCNIDEDMTACSVAWPLWPLLEDPGVSRDVEAPVGVMDPAPRVDCTISSYSNCTVDDQDIFIPSTERDSCDGATVVSLPSGHYVVYGYNLLTGGTTLELYEESNDIDGLQRGSEACSSGVPSDTRLF